MTFLTGIKEFRQQLRWCRHINSNHLLELNCDCINFDCGIFSLLLSAITMLWNLTHAKCYTAMIKLSRGFAMKCTAHSDYTKSEIYSFPQDTQTNDYTDVSGSLCNYAGTSVSPNIANTVATRPWIGYSRIIRNVPKSEGTQTSKVKYFISVICKYKLLVASDL
jgi:hypothetical protein